MYMIEITEDRLQSMTEHVEKGLKHLGKLMQCLESLEEETSGAYGEKGRLGLRKSNYYEDEDYRENERYINRMKRY